MAASARARVKPNIILVLADDQYPGTEASMQAMNNIVSRDVEVTNMTSTYP